MTYLNLYPEGLKKCFIYGGVPGLVQSASEISEVRCTVEYWPGLPPRLQSRTGTATVFLICWRERNKVVFTIWKILGLGDVWNR